MRTVFTTSALFFFFVLLLASCQSSQSVFSKRGEDYRSAREIAEEKRQDRKARRLARKNKSDNSNSNIAFRSRRKPKDVDKDIYKVITTARSFTGTPYKWGGTTRVGMDCSGLLCTSFQSIDVKLPRTSQEQSKYGKDVRMKDLKEGDLVFFGATSNSREITHVGMVTEVISDENIKFIHASTSLGVIENNIFSPHYQKIFIKAVRPFIHNYTADNKE